MAPASFERTRSRAAVEYVTIGCGGAIGALARFAIDWALPATATGFPWATFSANISGSILLGFGSAFLQRRQAPALLRIFLTVGVLSSYTTFSTFAVQYWQRSAAGAPATAAFYVVSSVLLGVAAAALGFRLGSGPSPEQP